ncbi:hypothetical protein DVA76_18845 [Acinetobacter baumannii]|nr:hypothetical protein DVA76_18845 [Acinetobacter baumannii]
MRDLETLKYFLGVAICQTNKGIFLSQRKYVPNLLEEAKYAWIASYSSNRSEP